MKGFELPPPPLPSEYIHEIGGLKTFWFCNDWLRKVACYSMYLGRINYFFSRRNIIGKYSSIISNYLQAHSYSYDTYLTEKMHYL